LVAAVAAITDFRTGHIPNWLTLAVLPAAIVAHAVRGFLYGGAQLGAIEAGMSLAGAAACALVPLMMFWKGAIGGGDVKLFAAIGALCHPMAGLEIEMYAFVAAAFIAPARLAYKGVLLRSLGNTLALAVNPFRPRDKRREVPEEMMTWFRLGPCILLGALGTLLAHWNLG